MQILTLLGHDIGEDQSRRNGVNADAVLTELDGEDVRQRVHRRRWSHCSARRRSADLEAPDEMFKTAPFTPSAIHRVRNCLAGQHRPPGVDVEDAVPLLDGYVEQEQFGKMPWGIGENAGQPSFSSASATNRTASSFCAWSPTVHAVCPDDARRVLQPRGRRALPSRSAMTTEAPSRRKTSLMARPSLPAAPVTNAIRFARSIVIKPFKREREAMASSSASIAWRKPQAMRLRRAGGADKKEVEPVASRRRVRKFPRSA